MTNEDKIKAIAELDGLTINGPSTDPAAPEGWCWNDKGNNCWFEELEYLTSYDAIIPVFQKQSDSVQGDILDATFEMFRQKYDKCNNASILLLTPEQLSDALLKACGRWIENGTKRIGLKSCWNSTQDSELRN